MKIRLMLLICVMLLSQQVWPLTSEEAAKILASDGSRGEKFGSGVSISGDTAIIGTPYDRDSNTGLATAGAAYIYVLSGDKWEMQAKLIPPEEDGDPGDNFGTSVSIDGNIAVIGAPEDDGESNEDTFSGAAYIYTRSGADWELQTKLYDPKPEPGPGEDPEAKHNDRFGRSVSISGETVIIGAPKLTFPYPGLPAAAYIYTRSGADWLLSSEFTDLPRSAGSSVSISGNTAVVGAFADNEFGGSTGSALVYFRSGNIWSYQTKLSPSDRAAGDAFGGSVAIDNDTIIAGAYGDDDLGENSGSAYVFTRAGSNWKEQAKIHPSDGSAHDLFGRSVSISGDLAVVSNNRDSRCPIDPNSCGLPGAVYVFKRNVSVWEEKTILKASDGEPGDQFGGYYAPLSLSGNTVIVGAPEDDNEKGIGAGSAYIFNLSLDTGEDDLQFIETGLGHTCFTNADNQVVCWGN